MQILVCHVQHPSYPDNLHPLKTMWLCYNIVLFPLTQFIIDMAKTELRFWAVIAETSDMVFFLGRTI